MSTTTSIVLIADTADKLTSTVATILGQSAPVFELLVVDRSGAPAVAALLRQFADRRITYVAQAHRQSTSVALATALRQVTGEFVAFAAPGDVWHPTRLQRHVDMLETQKSIGATYNIRMEMGDNGAHLYLWQPASVTLADLVLGLPLALDDLVVRRSWLAKLVLTNRHGVAQADAADHAVNADLLYQLALANCPFAALPQLLHQRPLSPAPMWHDLTKVTAVEMALLAGVFADRRCPPAVKALRKRALGRTALSCSYQAFDQQETTLGQSLLRSAIRYNRTILDVAGRGYRNFLARNARQHECNPEILIQRQFTQLPPELAWLNRFKAQTIARSYLYQGAHNLLWGQLEQGRSKLQRAAIGCAGLDRPFLYELLNQLLAYEAAFGPTEAETALGYITHNFRPLAAAQELRWLRSRYFADRALRHYHHDQYRAVPVDTLKAVGAHPAYAANRGMWSIFFRSLVYSLRVRTTSLALRRTT